MFDLNVSKYEFHYIKQSIGCNNEPLDQENIE